MRAGLVVVLASAAACTDAQTIMIPGPEPGEQTLLFVIDVDGADRPFDLRKESAPRAFRAPVGAQVAWLYYERTVEQLFFDVTFGSSARPFQRPVPRAHRVFVPSGDETWLEDHQLVAPTPEECAGRGGCYPDAESSEVYACEVPCVASATVSAPAAPEAPRFLPCPAGWREVPVGGSDPVMACEPPIERDDTCPGAAPWLSGCAEVAPCPAGIWPEPTNADLFVSAGAAAGGDGSLALPFLTLGEALAMAQDGAVIAIAKGDYDEAVLVERSVRIEGACASETRLSSLTDTLLVRADSATISGVRVTGGSALNVERGVTRVEEVHFLSANTSPVVGVSAGARLSGRRVLVDGGERLVGVQCRGALELDDASLLASQPWLVDVREAGSSVSLRDSFGRSSSGSIYARTDATLEIRRSVFEDAVPNAIVAYERAHATLEDVLVRGGAEVYRAWAVYVRADSVLVASRLRVEDRTGNALYLHNAQLHVADVIASDIRMRVANDEGYSGVALLMYNSGGEADRFFASDLDGFGVLHIDDEEGAAGPAVSLRDVHVRRIGGRVEESSGDGLTFLGPPASVDRVLVEGAERYGVGLLRDSRVDIRDLEVRASDSGVRIDGVSDLTLERAELAGNRLGICVVREVFLRGSDVFIHGSVNRDGDTCAHSSPTGVGLIYGGTGRIELDRFVIADNEGAALSYPLPLQRLTNGWITRNGYAVHAPEQHLKRAMVRVLIEDNAQLRLPLGTDE